jgi:hypothetical protein
MPKQCSVTGCSYDSWGKDKLTREPYCRFHQYLRTDKKIKVYKPIKKLKWKRKNTGESNVNSEISKEREHICESCGEKLEDVLYPNNFSHVIRKSRNKSIRLNKLNIMLECIDCHYVWDNGTWKERMEMKSWNRKLEIIKELDIEYYNLIQLKIKNFVKSE